MRSRKLLAIFLPLAIFASLTLCERGDTYTSMVAGILVSSAASSCPVASTDQSKPPQPSDPTMSCCHDLLAVHSKDFTTENEFLFSINDTVFHSDTLTEIPQSLLLAQFLEDYGESSPILFPTEYFRFISPVHAPPHQT